MQFTPIDGKHSVEAYCLVKKCDVKTSTKGDTYLDLTLSDKTGEISAKLWSYSEPLHGSYGEGDLVKVRGMLQQYNGADQLRVERIRHVTPEDNVSPGDYVQSAAYDGEAMYRTLHDLAAGFADRDLSKLVTRILEENREKLLYWPAAVRLHHAIRGGLLMHTLSIVRLAEQVAAIYPFVDRELLLSGAILHDIAKTVEFEVSAAGVATGYSVRGNLIGHLVDGAGIVRKAAAALGTPDELTTLLEHMLLSHHEEPEFGAAVRPMFLEAELLAELDLLDSRLYEMREAVLGVNPGEFTARIWALDNRRLYRHGRTPEDSDVRLLD